MEYSRRWAAKVPALPLQQRLREADPVHAAIFRRARARDTWPEALSKPWFRVHGTSAQYRRLRDSSVPPRYRSGPEDARIPVVRTSPQPPTSSIRLVGQRCRPLQPLSRRSGDRLRRSGGQGGRADAVPSSRSNSGETSMKDRRLGRRERYPVPCDDAAGPPCAPRTSSASTRSSSTSRGRTRDVILEPFLREAPATCGPTADDRRGRLGPLAGRPGQSSSPRRAIEVVEKDQAELRVRRRWGDGWRSGGDRGGARRSGKNRRRR